MHTEGNTKIFMTQGHARLLAKYFKIYGIPFYDNTSKHFYHSSKDCLKKIHHSLLIKEHILKEEAELLKSKDLSHSVFGKIVQEQKRGWSGLRGKFDTLINKIESLLKKCEEGVVRPSDELIGPWTAWKDEYDEWLKLAIDSGCFGRRGRKIEFNLPCEGNSSASDEEFICIKPSKRYRRRTHVSKLEILVSENKEPELSTNRRKSPSESKTPATGEKRSRSGKQRLSQTAPSFLNNNTSNSIFDLAVHSAIDLVSPPTAPLSSPSLPPNHPNKQGDTEANGYAEISLGVQMTEQTVVLKTISEQLTGIKDVLERNATTTNAALLILMNHVLKEENQANGEGSLVPPATEKAAVTDVNGIIADSDSKSIGLDVDAISIKPE